MKTLSLAVLLALAGTSAAQEQTRAEARKPALNLRLDEGTSSAPRITFEQQRSAQTKDEREKGLPELGGKPSQAFDRKVSSPVNSSSGDSVIPSAMDPALNRE